MSAADSLIGRKLGDYTIKSLLGRGGMSRVYRGYDENLDRFAAVKVISGDFATTTEEEYTRRFQIEARSIARLRHPNIVAVYQFGRTEGIYYMAMVFLEGKDLRMVLKDYAEQGQRMPTNEVVRIARDVAGALDYAHEQGVIHRDIKPSNIMLEKRTGRAILMDFGLALSIQEGTTGDTFGSAHYIAPEQAISSAKAVSQSDLYSLGVVLYEMLTGKVPFDDPSAMSVALKHLNELPPPPTMYNPDLPAPVEAVIMRVLDKDPTRRYETGSQFVDALEEAFSKARRAVSPPQPAGPPVVSLLDSSPTPLLSKQPTASQPMPKVPPFESPENEAKKRGGIAGRFALRKARKEEEAALEELSEDSLQIDGDTLNKILKGYADPSEIGLVGEKATGVTLSQEFIDIPTSSTGVSVPSSIAVRKPKRRSRVGLLLTLLLIAIVGGASIWFALGRGEDEEPPATDDGTQIAAMPLATDAATEIATAAVTETVTESATESAVLPLVTEAATEPAETEPATSAATEALATPEATEEISEPTATQTASQTPSPEPTTATETVEPTNTPQPDRSPSPATGPAPNVQLYYDEHQLWLVNISDAPININKVVFEQDRRDGTKLAFAASLWDRVVAEKTIKLGPAGCYHLMQADATNVPPDEALCPRYLGWVWSNAPQRYFWISEQPGATFVARLMDDTTPLATCEITAGECAFYVPQ